MKKIQMEFWVLISSSRSVPPLGFNILHWDHQEMFPTLKHKEERNEFLWRLSWLHLFLCISFENTIPWLRKRFRNIETLWILSLKCLYNQQTEWNPLKKCWGPKGNQMTKCHSSKEYTLNIMETFLHKLRKLVYGIISAIFLNSR